MNTSGFTFSGHDRLSLKAFGETLEAFLSTERHFVEGSLVLSLNAQFGSGKSTFLSMWRNDLLERRKSHPELPIPILLNAWEGDHCGDPLLAIVSGLTMQIDVDGGQKAAVNKIRDAAKDAAWMAVGLGNSFVASATGIDAVEAGELADKKRKAREQKTDDAIDLLKSYEIRTNALFRLKAALSEAFEKQFAIIMVDELDRCRPDYAILFLEAIKHIFQVEQIAFVLAVDKSQLRSSAEVLFGSRLNFDEYYRKFVHRNVDLPEPDRKTVRPLIDDYLEKIVIGGVRHTGFSFGQKNDITYSHFIALAVGLKMTPRQIHEMFRIVGHMMTVTKKPDGEMFWGIYAAALLMAGLSVGNVELYHQLGRTRPKWSAIFLSLQSIFDEKRDFEWWMTLLLSGDVGTPRTSDLKGILEMFPHKAFSRFSTEDELQRELSGVSHAWGHHGAYDQPFPKIYAQIEKLMRFAG